jgi:hypothetical protein
MGMGADARGLSTITRDSGTSGDKCLNEIPVSRGGPDIGPPPATSGWLMSEIRADAPIAAAGRRPARVQ